MPFPNNDILLLISEHLDNQKDKVHLLLVCRYWYSLLLPKAYQTTFIGREQIYFLARSIQKNPRIGAAIRNLTVEWDSGTRTGDYEVDMLMKTLRLATEPEDDLDLDNWEEDLRRGCGDAWLAVLVLSLEFVKTMDLQLTYSSPYFFPMLRRIAAKKNPFGSKPVLQHLERVYVWTESMKDHYNASELFPFFCLPAMRVFTGGGICEDEHTVAAPEPGTSGIRELDLGGFNTNNGSKGMADFINSCANLEIFDYQHDNKAIWGESYLDFRPFQFYNALCSQQHSLRELRLNHRGEQYSEGMDDENEGDWEGFGSLAGFHRLRELQIPLRTLLQFGSTDQPKVSLVEVLPPSLEHLNLATCRDHDFDIVIKNLRGVLAHREERFPNLKRLEVQPDVLEVVSGAPGPYSRDFVVTEFTQQSFAPVGIACRAMGIQFGFSKDGVCLIREA
jgi:hypothetical protein